MIDILEIIIAAGADPWGGGVDLSHKNIFSNDIYTSNVRISITSCGSSLQNKYVVLRQQNDHF